MQGYAFTRPRSVLEAVRDAGADTAFLAGGTTLVDLMKLDVMAPARVVDINRLPLRGIAHDRDGLRVGALERMSDVAADPAVRREYPVIAEALELSASAQLRNMASIGGTCCSAPGAATSGTSRPPATSGSPAAAARH